MPYLIAGGLVLGALGFAVDQTGEAVEQTGDTLIKVAVAAGVLYYVGKKVGVI